jgi:hypothetical protein
MKGPIGAAEKKGGVLAFAEDRVDGSRVLTVLRKFSILTSYFPDTSLDVVFRVKERIPNGPEV